MDFLNPKIGGTTTVLESPARTSASIVGRVLNFCLLALVFLIPLFFLPLTSEAREFNKQNLLVLGVLVLLATWVVKVLTRRRLSWVRTPLDYAVVGYGLVYLLSSFVSLDRSSSFLGYWGRFTGSTVSVLALVLLYFLVVNNVRGHRLVRKIMDWFVYSSGIVIIFSLLQLTGNFLFKSFGSASFNTVGSMVGLSIFCAASILVYQWELMINRESHLLKRILVGVLTLLAIITLFIVNAFVGWLVLSLGLVFFIAFAVVTTPDDATEQSWFWKPMLVLVVSILFLALQIFPSIGANRQLNAWRAKLTRNSLPVEIQLSNSATYSMVKNSLTSGFKSALIGSGPGTTGIAFGEIKPADLNKTVVWSLNFDRASSEFANIIIETGVLGLIAFEAVSIMFLIYGLFFLLRRDHPGRGYALGFYLIWAVLFISHFFYFFNTISYFFYWLSIGLFMALAHNEQADMSDRDLSFAQSPRAALSGMFVSLLMLVLILVGAFFEISIYTAETSYARGVKTLNQKDPDFTKAESQFESAANLNPYRDVYHLGVAQNLIFLSSIEAAKKDPNIQNINNWIASAILEGKAATNASPNKASNWSTLAQIYNAIRPFGVQGTADEAVKAWKAAIEHDSKNPALYVQLASSYSEGSTIIDPSITGSGTDSDNDGLSDEQESKIGSDPHNSDTNHNSYKDGEEVIAGFDPAGAGRLSASVLAQFQKTDNAKLKSAEDALNEAIAIKPDLPDSYIAKARVLEKEKNLKDAKAVLDDAALKFPSNADILFEQGRITYNNGDTNGAEKIFNSVLKLQPKQPDALFSLGLIYEGRGDKTKALDYYKQVREITGPNVDLDKRINDLQNPPETPAK